jgi:hypothetical protein
VPAADAPPSGSPWAAQGIEAEILFCRTAAKKIAAESPVFLSASRTKKCARILLPENSWRKIIGLVQESRGYLSSPAEFAA